MAQKSKVNGRPASRKEIFLEIHIIRYMPISGCKWQGIDLGPCMTNRHGIYYAIRAPKAHNNTFHLLDATFITESNILPSTFFITMMNSRVINSMKFLSGMNNLHLRILAAGYPHDEHRFFWMWYDDRPQRTQIVCVLLWRLPKLDVPFV